MCVRVCVFFYLSLAAEHRLFRRKEEKKRRKFMRKGQACLSGEEQRQAPEISYKEEIFGYSSVFMKRATLFLR